MPTLVPTHTVILSRPHPSGRKDKEGNPLTQRIVPKLGEPFEFTDEEAEQLRAANPGGVRDPVNEGGEVKEEADVERAVREAHETARATRTAAVDATATARAGATGRGARRQADNSGAGETRGPGLENETEDEDEL